MESDEEDHRVLFSEDPINGNSSLSDGTRNSFASLFSFVTIQFVVEFVLVASYSFGFSYVLALPYCGFLFQCGCTWFWKGGINKYEVFLKLFISFLLLSPIPNPTNQTQIQNRIDIKSKISDEVIQSKESNRNQNQNQTGKRN
jgi:hypothetical protein